MRRRTFAGGIDSDGRVDDPAVQQVTAAPSKAALVGKPVNIECVVGAAGEMKLDTNSP